MTTHSYAQTNLQLFNQLQTTGYAEADLLCMAKSYELASRLFTGAFRGSGKPFLAHLVGTASIVATLQQPIAVIAAGLLHAAYELGEFGDGSRGMVDWKRSQIQHAVGAETLDAVLSSQIPSPLVSRHAYSYRIATPSPTRLQQWKKRVAALF